MTEQNTIRKFFFTLLIASFFATATFGQAKIRKLPPVINHPSLNLTAPYMSADGNALVFISDGGQDGSLIVSYTSRDRDWSPPADLPKHLNNRLNFLKGYALSADGKTIFLTSAKSPTVGGYDIVFSELKGSTWSNPTNLMLPINTKSNEGCPSVTPDGKTMYFMRCDQMDQYTASACKIFSTTKAANGQWSEPVELPSGINTGNSQVPRILPDGETLIFSSDKFGGKGKMDLLMTKKDNGNWTSPVLLHFVNTERDDQFVTVTAVGRYLIREAKGARNNLELTEFLFPEDMRPKALTKVEGTVSGQVPSYISVTDLEAEKRIISTRPSADGTFFFYLPEGKGYELSVDPEQPQFTYSSSYFDLSSDKIPQKEKVDIILKRPEAGDEIPLPLVAFDSSAATLTNLAERELQRFARLVKANPDRVFEVHLEMFGVKSDSIQSSPDLTEMHVDTVTVAADTTLGLPERKLAKITYHNDRTPLQEEALRTFLNKEGVKPDQLEFITQTVESEVHPRLRIWALVR